MPRALPIGSSDLLALAALFGACAAVAAFAWNRNWRLSPFWILQTVGWLGYGAAKYFLNPVFYPTARHALVLISIGFTITLGLRQLYRVFRLRGWPAPRLIVVAIVLSPPAAFVWLVAHELILGRGWTNVVAPDFPRTVLNKALVLLAWSGFYIAAKTWTAVIDERERGAKIASTAANAELQLLRYQLNPHFLFNALNSVNALIDEDARRARQMVRDLSDFLRYSLRGGHTDVPLREEFESLERYLGIEKIRFEDRLEVNVRLDDDAAGCAVPSFLLHPLVENAVKHGVRTSDGRLSIRIEAARNDGTLQIEVWNSGRLDGAARSDGIGLENVRRRLEQRFPGRASFDLREDGGGVRARVTIT